MKNLIQFFEHPRHLAAAIALVSAATLAAAYISQYGFGLKPCILCLYQRGPYGLNIALGGLAVLATLRYPRLAVFILYAAALSFLTGAAIAGFHVGVEQGWWPGLSSCGGQIVPEGVSLEELRKALEEQEIVSCSKPAWTLFGISMAGYNFAMSLVLAFITLFLLRKKHHGPQN